MIVHPARGFSMRFQIRFHALYLMPLAALALAASLFLSPAAAAASCFGNDVGAGSTERADHLSWASAREAAEVSANLAGKVDALMTCARDDNALRAIFADLSVVVALQNLDASCFGGDAGVLIRERQPHLDWAMGQGHTAIADNLRWKIGSAMECVDRPGQDNLFADLSVTIAVAAAGLASAPADPGQVVWQLGQINFENTAPYPNVALRVDDLQANPLGGFMKITALNDGECAPGAGMPASDMVQRFKFSWEFDRDVSRLTYPDKVTARIWIEADADLPCLDLDPIIQVGADGLVLQTPQSGERYYFRPDTSGHSGGPRTVDVVTAESGLERSDTAYAPLIKIIVWGFRGNRGMQMEATYPYTLAGAPAQ